MPLPDFLSLLSNSASLLLIMQYSEPRLVKGADSYSYNPENKMLRIEKSGSAFKIKIKNLESI